MGRHDLPGGPGEDQGVRRTAMGIENPVHFDVEAAGAAGFRDVAAPPMFCVVYALPALAPAILDPEVGINFATMVHGGQELRVGRAGLSRDEITTTAEVHRDLREGRQGLLRLRVGRPSTRTASRSCTRTWTNIVRGV